MKMHIEYDDFGEYEEFLDENEADFTMKGSTHEKDLLETGCA